MAPTGVATAPDGREGSASHRTLAIRAQDEDGRTLVVKNLSLHRHEAYGGGEGAMV